jgi:hypothetical protein
MAASIRSLRNGILPVDDASRDDLVVGDVVNVSALAPATSYAWVLTFVPDGSAATFSGSSTAVSPGNFTVDLPGPYLVRLTTDIGLPTEATQYVRLRVLTPSLNLRLVAAGERRDSTGVIPVDASPEGWANDQNYNLQTLEAAILSPPGTGANIISLPFTFATASPAVVCPLAATAYILHTRVFISTPFDDPAATIDVGVTGTPSALQGVGDNDPTVAATYISDETYPSSGLTNVILTLNPAASMAGAGVVFVLVHNP